MLQASKTNKRFVDEISTNFDVEQIVLLSFDWNELPAIKSCIEISIKCGQRSTVPADKEVLDLDDVMPKSLDVKGNLANGKVFVSLVFERLQ